MQIVVNTRMLMKNRLDGIGWFSYHTLKRITNTQKDIHFIFLFDRPFDDEFIFSDNITPLSIGAPARHAFLFYAWYQHSVKNILNRMQPTLFLSPDGMLSLGAKCQQLPVIHDINFLHHPKDVPFWARNFYNHYFPKYAHEAARIATVSEYSKKDISNSYGIDPNKIDVVYNGINEIFKPIPQNEIQATRDKYTQGKPYFVFVGSMHSRKNIPRLLKAFELFKKDSSSNLKLVLAGPFFWGKDEIGNILDNMQFKQDVIFTGRLNNDELNSVVAAAFCMTFVPYFEGFGIPLVEAMRCGVPIICSNVTSMPEVVGNAALLVNPHNESEIKDAMILLWKNEKLRNELIIKGNERSLLFSWDKTADLLWSSIEKTLSI